jgi:hypothetical protein
MGAPSRRSHLLARENGEVYGPQHPCVKQTAPAPQSAEEVHSTKVQTSWTHACPSRVETHAHPAEPPHVTLQPVLPVQVDVPLPQVGTQNDLGVTHCPFPAQIVPDGQHVVAPPVKFGQQLVSGGQQTDPVGD